MKNSDGLDLIHALTQGISTDDFALITLQAAIASEISIRRVKLGMNQKQFAEFMGVSQGLVSRWEQGETNFTLETIVKIASKLDIELQCPFKLAPAPVYYETQSSSNIVDFHRAKDSIRWNATGYSSSEYCTLSHDLMEM